MKLIKNLLIVTLLFFIVIPAVFSDEKPADTPPNGEGITGRDPGITRMKGDQVFSFNAGLIFPLFFSDTDFEFTNGMEHLSLGGVGSLEWSSYLTSRLFLGGQLSGMFAITENERTISMVPICARIGYVFNLHPVTIPLTFGAGFSFNKLDDLFEFTPALKPGVSVLWNLNYEWSVGLNINYWWIPEFHTGDLSSQTRFGSFLETSFAAAYHF